MNKILFVATIFKHFRAFHLPYIEWFQRQGWSVDAMANGDDLLENVRQSFNIPVSRSPFALSNIQAVRQAREIIEREKYDIVYCHTAMGAVLARLAAKKARKKYGTKVIYVAHGFHFFKGCPKKSWCMYYPMEKFLSRYTDAIITINEEDFRLVKTHGFKNKNTYKIPGIGINTTRLIETSDDTRAKLRSEFGYRQDEFILIYIAEYIERKNHRFIIEAMPELVRKIPSIRVMFAGRGRLMEEMKSLSSKLGVEKHIDFLGFRRDIGQCIAVADIGISASRQEGLPINIAEEMYEGLPVIATEGRGHNELVIDGETGFLFPQLDTEAFVDRVKTLCENPELRLRMGNCAKTYIQKFTLDNAIASLAEIFKKYM